MMLSKNLEMSLHRSLAIAKNFNHEYATLEHLLLSLTEDIDASAVMKGCGVNLELLRRELCDFIENDLIDLVVNNIDESKPTSGFQRVIHRAAIHVQSAGKSEVTGANVIVALFSERESHAVYFLQEHDLSRLDIVNYISHGVVKISEPPKLGSAIKAPEDEKMIEDDKANPAKAKGDALSNYCVNLNKRAETGKIDILVGREKEIERTIQVLCRRSKNNPLFVGDAGVGKTAIAEGIALRIVRGDVPDILKRCIIFSLDIGALLAGTRYRGDFEERIKAIVKEIEKLPDAILFIDEIHTLIGTGSTSGGALDAGNLLKPALARGSFRCIGSTTYNEFRNFFEKDRALVRRFQKIDIPEPTIEDSVKILRGLRPYYEDHHGVKFTDAAIRAAVELSVRYVNDRKLPDKAIDVIDEAGAAQKLLPESRRKKSIGVKEVEEIVSRIARIPMKTLSSDDSEVLRNLDQNLKLVVFGQSGAVDSLVSAIKMSRAGLRDAEKPVGCFLFTGPTGVGKTEVAKQLSKAMGMELLRFDMSEYMEKHSISRLIGSPPGYVGFEQGGLLTEAVDKQPYCIVLLDEIEKAHPDIFNILLQVMDYGRLTDNNGKSVSFRNVVLIMTSNAGASEMAKPAIGFGRGNKEGEDKDALVRLFTPEFRNRLDAVIPFTGLSREVVASVVDKFMAQLESQLADRNISIHLTEEARVWLADKGYDPNFGARPLDRLIADKIKRPLADEVLFGKLTKGGCVSIDIKDDEINFSFPPEGSNKSAARKQHKAPVI